MFAHFLLLTQLQVSIAFEIHKIVLQVATTGKSSQILMNTLQRIPGYASNSDSKVRSSSGKPRKSFVVKKRASKWRMALSKTMIEARGAQGVNQTFLLPYPGKDNKKQTCWSEPPGTDFMFEAQITWLTVASSVKTYCTRDINFELASMEKDVKVETMAGLAGSTADYLASNATLVDGVKKEVCFAVFILPFCSSPFIIIDTNFFAFCQAQLFVVTFWCLDTSSRGRVNSVKAWSQTQGLMNCGRSYNSPDDNYRNERLKILPNIPDGNWIVKKTVGRSQQLLQGRLMPNGIEVQIILKWFMTSALRMLEIKFSVL